ncbi:MAG: glycosyltransferase family 1 protein [Candidatus Hydrogenedentes bacterium]|nr:glycosyltransferase family 1 protein [Candidatus Hydrogenedentota bacterium]
MHVLLDGMQAVNKSGIGSYTCALMRELPAVSKDLELRALCPFTMLEEFKEVESMSLVPCTDARSPLASLHRSFVMAKSVGRQPTDLLHYPASFTRFLGSGLSRASKVILTVHDLSFLREPGWFRWDRSVYYRAMIRRSVRHATRILADSEATSRDLQDYLDVDPSRIDVTPLGVDSRFRPASDNEVARARETYKLPKTFFLFVGTLEPRKNVPRLIQAFDSIAGECEADLAIAGRDGWKFDSIYDAAAAAKHSGRIHFLGYVADDMLPAVLSAAEAFVWPSLWEGFGLPPLEAMACGAPVITSNTSSLPEVVGDAALTVPPEDADAIAHAMRSLLADPELRRSLRDRGMRRAGEFTWRRTAEQTYAAYRKACEMN